MLPEVIVERVVQAALAEDSPWGDLTSEAFVPETLSARGALVLKQEAVVCGLGVAAEVFRQCDPEVRWQALAEDGARMPSGQVVATVNGAARGLLRAERIALNFLQRLSGVATATAALVARVREAGASATIIDTRKTTPGLRVLEKYAVRTGGGGNHRFGLSDGVLVKDNHLAVLAREGISLGDAIARARRRVPHTVKIQVEVESVAQAREAIAAGAGLLLLDNMSLEDLRAVVALKPDGVLTEASGNVTLERVGEIAATGVDLISSGAVTHSAPSVDISLDFEA